MSKYTPIKDIIAPSGSDDATNKNVPYVWAGLMWDIQTELNDEECWLQDCHASLYLVTKEVFESYRRDYQESKKTMNRYTNYDGDWEAGFQDYQSESIMAQYERLV